MKHWKGLLTAAVTAILILTAAGCSGTGSGGDGPVVSFDSTEIQVGSSTLQELFDAGFKPSEQSLDGRSWDDYALYKEGDEYCGKVRIKNTSASPRDKGKCIIFAAEARYEWLEPGAVLVDGIDFKDRTPEELDDLLPGFTNDGDRGREGSCYYVSDNCTYRFDFADGVVHTLLVVDGTDAVYEDRGVQFGTY